MSQRKPGKLKANRMIINLDAMKPGAINPLIEKRRRTLSKHSRDGNKPHRSISPNRAKPLPSPPRRKSYKALLVDADEQQSAKLFKRTLNTPLNPVPTHAHHIKILPKTPPTPPSALGLMDLSPTNSLSLIDCVPTPFGDDNSDMDALTPVPPATPTSPAPPPKHIQMKADGCFDVLSIPPQPPAPVLTSIHKAPRDTAASTTFTISGQKITVIGHARTGKTSLKNALFGRQFEHMTFPTIKAPLKPTIVVKPFDGDMNVQYEVWDTPGQKVLEYIPPLYITGSFCVLVVYDITDVYSYERAQYWIHYLEENAKGYDNVVLIGNKYDLRNVEQCVDSEQVQFYAEQHGIFFIEISVKTKYNFDVLVTWLNTKTQEKFMKDMQIDDDKMKYEEWDLCEEVCEDACGRKKMKKSTKQRKKEWIKYHQRHQAIKLDISQNKKRNGNCSC